MIKSQLLYKVLTNTTWEIYNIQLEDETNFNTCPSHERHKANICRI